MLRWRLIWPYTIAVCLVMGGLGFILGARLPSTAPFLYIAIAVATLLLFAILLLMIERTLRPIRQITFAAEHMLAGDEHDLPPADYDDVRRLAKVLYALADKRRRQKHKRERESDRLRTVLTYMADGVLILNKNGKVRLLNPAAERILEVSAEHAQGRTFIQAVRDDRAAALWNRCRASGEEEIDAIEFDDDRFVRMVVTPFLRGAARGYLVLLQDLTQMRRLQTVRQDFVSNVSHELRTPLAALRALAETLNDGALEDPPAARRFLARIEEEVDMLTQMVSELLELSSLESGKLPLSLALVLPHEVLVPSAERLAPQATRANLTLHIDVSDQLPPVAADAGRIQQVMTNLVHNAIKFTPPNGQITVSAVRENGVIAVSVADNGVGIPSEDLPRIFERFYKSDRARAGAGTGLGLAIAKHIIQIHHGDIWVDSQEGRGSTFTFTLPVVAEK